jgi:metalloprotease
VFRNLPSKFFLDIHLKKHSSAALSSASAITLAIALAACTSNPTTTTGAPAAATKTQPAKTDANSGGGALSTLGALAGAATSGGTGATTSENKVGAGLDFMKAATVSDADLKSMSLQLRARDDKKFKVAAPGSKHGQRLARLTAKHLNEDGMTLNFKAYVSPAINANASADGSVRVYTGLMDKMTDAELLGVIGHEIGHVKLAHSASRLRTAYLASAGRKAAASSSGAVGALADSDLGALGETLVKSQFSQSQETDSDDYGLAFMKKHGYDVKGMESAFRKIAAQGSGSKGGLAEMLSTHPDAGKRADRMRDKAGSK